VGSAGRPDLLGFDRADSLARLQYGSVRRLADLPDEVGLYPTHGAGSFCTASGAGAFTSTIGEEKKTNRVLTYTDEDSFVAGQLSGLVPYPSYYAHMGPANVNGVSPIAGYDVPIITEEQFSALEPDVHVIDARPKPDFASGHLPGSLAIELRNDFGVWVGWVVPFNAPLVVVMNPGQDREEALRQLSRIGFDDVRGVILDVATWSTALDSYRLATADEFAEAVANGAQMLDTRAPNEWETGMVEASTRCYAPDVISGTPAGLDQNRPLWIACETGYRASIAASALQSRGFEPVVLAEAGVTEVLRSLSKL
jgi:rhodanese-related sulfurtransferase